MTDEVVFVIKGNLCLDLLRADDSTWLYWVLMAGKTTLLSQLTKWASRLNHSQVFQVQQEM